MIQAFSSLLTIETGLLLLSALKRLVLYADAHGLTRARIFGFILLVWLSIILVIFLYRVFKKMKKEWFFVNTLSVTLFIFLLINVINIDGIIATKYRPTVNNEIDYFYLTSLSTDAYPSWKSAIQDSEMTIYRLKLVQNLSSEDNRQLYWSRATLEQLKIQLDYLRERYECAKPKKWQSFNFSEFEAFLNTFCYKDATIDKLQKLLMEIESIERRISIEIRQNTPIDRSTNPPLLR